MEGGSARAGPLPRAPGVACLLAGEGAPALLFTLRDGKIAEIQDFFSDMETTDRMFS